MGSLRAPLFCVQFGLTIFRLSAGPIRLIVVRRGMLPSRHRKPSPTVPPGYAKYKLLDLDLTIRTRRTPYEGNVRSSACDALEMNRERFPFLFEYVKFDESGALEVFTWLEDRHGRELWHDRNSAKQNEQAKWWIVTDGLIGLSDVAVATEFRLRWC